MSQPPRPLFTKSRTTKRPRGAGGGSGSSRTSRASRTPGRFHGAFTGGHSAGHFNTVGTEEGWTPTNEDNGGTYDGADDDDDGLDEFGRERPQQQQQQRASSSSGAAAGKKCPRVWDQSRSAEDYMDDRDYDEWAGPSSVSASYAGGADRKRSATEGGTSKEKGAIDDKHGLVPTELLVPVSGPADAIGRQLLRKLGWREGSGDDGVSSAYVPLQSTEKSGEVDEGGKNATCHEALLSKRRLRKIRLSERGHSLPPPKIDQYGLGYNPFQNAPEFEAHREMRRKRAEDRARAAGGGYGRYHTSDLLDEDDDEDEDGEANEELSRRKRPATGSKDDQRSKSNVLAYETAEDFVGKTGAGGFALHDDEDDVYDAAIGNDSSKTQSNGQTLVGIGGQEYHTELIDHGDSDVDEAGGFASGAGTGGNAAARTNGGRDTDAFEGALSAWAAGDAGGAPSQGSGTAASSAPIKKAVTSDGRPPLDGFVLGGIGGETDITNKRWPGPDLPRNYELVRHVFEEQDLPERVAQRSRTVRREAEHSRKDKANQGNKDDNSRRVASILKRDTDRPMAGAAFSSLADAMKNRFTTGAAETGERSEETAAIGLQMQGNKVSGGNVAGGDPVSNEEAQKEKEITVTRSMAMWNPAPLLCKRFGIRPPRPAGVPIGSQVGDGRTVTSTSKVSSEQYFQTEVLGVVGGGGGSQLQQQQQVLSDRKNSNREERNAPSQNAYASNVSVGTSSIDVADEPIKAPQVEENRPPMDLFKSIFGAADSSDSEESSSSEEEQEEGAGWDAQDAPKKESKSVLAVESSRAKGSEGLLVAGNEESGGLLGDSMPLQDEGNGKSAASTTPKDSESSTSCRHQQSRRSSSPGNSSLSTSSYERRRRQKSRKKNESRGGNKSKRRFGSSRDERKKKRRKRRSRSRDRSGRKDEDDSYGDRSRKERKRSKKSKKSNSSGSGYDKQRESASS